MRSLLLLIVFLAVSQFFAPKTYAHAQDPYLDPAPTLSDSAMVSYLWETSGTEIYTLWGHCALRVKDKGKQYDVVFNFGTFDPDVPSFELKFMQGSMLYTQSNYPFQYYLLEKAEQQNKVFELTLNISQSQKQAILNELYRRYRPENRYYHYDYFYENCSTKIRDILITTLGKDIHFSKTVYPFYSTFRDHIDPYLPVWIRFGISILLGMPTDKKISPYEEAFLPEYLASELKSETKADGKSLIMNEQIIHNNPLRPANSLFTPVLFFWLLFGIVMLLSVYTRFGKVFDLILFPLCGLLGFLILFLWFGSNYYGNKINLNLMWAFPLHLIFPFLKGKAREYYAWFILASTILILSGWSLIPQRFDPALIPILLILNLRSLFNLGFSDAINTLLQKRKKTLA